MSSWSQFLFLNPEGHVPGTLELRLHPGTRPVLKCDVTTASRPQEPVLPPPSRKPSRNAPVPTKLIFPIPDG